jgi:uncharacterized protein (DUF1501 family)
MERRLDRRAFLGRFLAAGAGLFGGLSLLSSSPRAGVRLAASSLLPSEEPRTLVLVQLAGGNDGLSTVVPHGDDEYHRLRPATALKGKGVLPLDDYRAFSAELSGLRALYDEGELAVVEGAGYPEPNRSHFKSFEIWHTADLAGRDAGEGWVGRLAGELFGDAPHPNHVVHVGGRVPYSLRSANHPPAAFATPEGYRYAGNEQDIADVTEGIEARTGDVPPAERLEWLRAMVRDAQVSSRRIRVAVDRYRPSVDYPDNDEFTRALRSVAALMDSGIGTRVYSVELSGFDTHNDQPNRHRTLMRRLDAGLSTFLSDVRDTPAGHGMVVMVFSEFGRRPKQNGSRGTDHGTAGPMFLAGAPVKGGLYGAHPSLTELDEKGDLVHEVDFRRVYASVIEQQFGVDAKRVLGPGFEPLPLITPA